jgi:hypothetical protein
MTGEYPYWVTSIKDFGSIIIALVALAVTAWIQIGQSRTSKTKLKLDLFTERFGIFRVLDKINRAVSTAHGDDWVGKYMSELGKAVEELQKCRLLFPLRIGNRVDEIVNAWHEFATLKAEGEGLPKPSDEWSQNIRDRRAL